MSKTISYIEPAERPRMVALSDGEILELVRHHVSMTKRVTKHVGKQLLTLSANSVMPKRRESNALIDQGRKIVDAHIARATGLQCILKEGGGK